MRTEWLRRRRWLALKIDNTLPYLNFIFQTKHTTRGRDGNFYLTQSLARACYHNAKISHSDAINHDIAVFSLQSIQHKTTV
jgi:hypothetical protein